MFVYVNSLVAFGAQVNYLYVLADQVVSLQMKREFPRERGGVREGRGGVGGVGRLAGGGGEVSKLQGDIARNVKCGRNERGEQ